jgi:hypothetical protein
MQHSPAYRVYPCTQSPTGRCYQRIAVRRYRLRSVAQEGIRCAAFVDAFSAVSIRADVLARPRCVVSYESAKQIWAS